NSLSYVDPRWDRRCLSWYLSTLPVALRGSSLTKTTCRGFLYPASLPRQNSTNSSWVSVAPDRSTSTAQTASPYCLAGTPITAHSSTDGCEAMTPSTSAG